MSLPSFLLAHAYQLPPAGYRAGRERLMLAMPDGVRLATDLYRPRTGGPVYLS